MDDQIVLSSDQYNAVHAITDWREQWPGGNQTFALGGLAGTGKTTIINHLSTLLPRPVIAAPTGKAAHILRSKGVEATTIHSMMYDTRNDKGKLVFVRRASIDADTIVIDEASMVDEQMLKDLCGYGLPILFVGDHGQLEPVGNNPHLMKDPDFRLETIHRQAAGCPILRLATAFREGREQQVWAATLERGWWQDTQRRCTVASKRHLGELLTDNMQVICGFNNTRHQLNREARAKLGFKDTICPGDKLICLKNNHRFGVFNGQILIVLGVDSMRARRAEVWLATDDGRQILAPCLTEQFGKNTFINEKDKAVLLLDYGNAMTAHKSQGSEFESVAVIEEIGSTWNACRWRYTTTTRAKNMLMYFV